MENAGFGVGDIVNFGETGNIEYETTATSTTDSTITIKLLDDVNGQGLQNQRTEKLYGRR